ncbi:hypothetical protein ACFY3U_11465 [Micromonospora sp. NPDC000089]|uniref:hypothetical protein n=1 Tax=unclassified Micromonospora TaxID=2617518 RepID=UPI0036CBA653
MPKNVRRSIATAVVASGTALLLPLTGGVASANPGSGGSAVKDKAATAAPGRTEASLSASCGWTPANNGGAAGRFLYDGVNIRSGQFISCTALGAGYTSHSVTYRCWAVGDTVGNWTTWTYLRDNTTGVTGWVTDAYLQDGGSKLHC